MKKFNFKVYSLSIALFYINTIPLFPTTIISVIIID